MCEEIRRTDSVCEVIPVKGGLHGIQLWEVLRQTGYKSRMTEWLSRRMD